MKVDAWLHTANVHPVKGKERKEGKGKPSENGATQLGGVKGSTQAEEALLCPRMPSQLETQTCLCTLTLLLHSASHTS